MSLFSRQSDVCNPARSISLRRLAIERDSSSDKLGNGSLAFASSAAAFMASSTIWPISASVSFFPPRASAALFASIAASNSAHPSDDLYVKV